MALSKVIQLPRLGNTELGVVLIKLKLPWLPTNVARHKWNIK